MNDRQKYIVESWQLANAIDAVLHEIFADGQIIEAVYDRVMYSVNETLEDDCEKITQVQQSDWW